MLHSFTANLYVLVSNVFTFDLVAIDNGEGPNSWEDDVLEDFSACCGCIDEADLG